MKRFRRWLFNGLAVASLILCLGTAALWMRSARHCDCVTYVVYPETDYSVLANPNPVYSIFTGPGVLNIARQIPGTSGTTDFSETPVFLFTSESLGTIRGDPLVGAVPWRPPAHEFSGIGWEESNKALWGPTFSPAILWRLSIPAWVLILCFSVFPFIRIRSISRNRQRSRHGICAICGYDLCATPDRCPECGTTRRKKK